MPKTTLALTKNAKVKTSFPRWIAPQLTTPLKIPPKNSYEGEWIHETKYDGYRMVVRKENSKIELLSRNQKEWGTKFKLLLKELSSLNAKKCFLDGEIIALDKKGRSNFQLLQNAIRIGDGSHLKFMLFDIMYFETNDLRSLPLIKRKEILKELVTELNSDLIDYSEHFLGLGQDMFKLACKEGLEGIISKKADSTYISKRTKTWLKIKCSGREEFVIIGFTPHSKQKNLIGALLLANRKSIRSPLEYRGKVGTGFSDETRKILFKDLIKLKSEKPLDFPNIKGAIWLKPKLIAEISFTEKTNEGLLRHPSFLGLRKDKSSKEVVEEKV